MKLKQRWYSKGEYTIAEAVAHKCDGSDYDRGSLETAAATARQTSEMLAALVELLHDNGALKDEDVLRLLPGFEVA